ncbi:MAG: hypothetical protein EXQ56_11710 [Acidobacteria bacterium]|nr:hypothetical protein [Acidobacteriota bacterium]
MLKHHPELRSRLGQVREILSSDPHNRTFTHPIKKLTGAAPGEGQYRLRLGRWRFRYDVHGNEVVLQYCGLRREDTYR